MNSYAMKLLAIVGLACVMQSVNVAADVEHTSSWGDLSDGRTVYFRTKSKTAIPFVTRDTDIDFPGVSFNRFHFIRNWN